MEPKNAGKLLDQNKTENDKNRTQKIQRQRGRRPRSLTTLKLEIISERSRKMQRVQEAISRGNYKIISVHVAKSLIKNFELEDLE